MDKMRKMVGGLWIFDTPEEAEKKLQKMKMRKGWGYRIFYREGKWHLDERKDYAKKEDIA